MSDDILREHKLVEAITNAPTNANPPVLNAMPTHEHAVDAEQQRETQENQRAHNAQGGIKERLIEIGKAQHMGGHGTGRVSDQ